MSARRIFDRATQAAAVPISERAMSDHVAINEAALLRKRMDDNPELEWTFWLKSGTQLYIMEGEREGDIVFVNQCASFNDHLGCHNSDHLGVVIRRDCVRLARPTDAGYVSTREEWHSLLNEENASLNRETFIAWALFIFTTGLLLTKLVQ